MVDSASTGSSGTTSSSGANTTASNTNSGGSVAYDSRTISNNWDAEFQPIVASALSGYSIITGGATSSQQNNSYNNYFVSGASTSIVTETVSGTASTGTKTSNSLLAILNGTMNYIVVEDGGSAAVVGTGATMHNSTALYNASLEAVGSGAVLASPYVGFSGAVFAGAITSGPNANYAVGAGTIFNPQVASHGYALVGGGGSDFVIKGYYANGPGGLISGGTFNPGSYYAVGLGGTASAGTIGGEQLLLSSGTSRNQLFIGSGASQYINSGGVASQSTALSGALLDVHGGIAIGLIGSNGGTIRVGGGTYFSVLNAGYATTFGDYTSGTSFNNTVLSGATERVDKDGLASHSTIQSGGMGTVLSGGTTIYPTVSGGTEIVSNGGILSSGTAEADGLIDIQSGGTARSVSAYSGGSIHLEKGATAANFVISSGGNDIIDPGAVIISGATINDGSGTLTLTSGAQADYLLASGGTAAAETGATASGLYAVNSGVGLLAQSGDNVASAMAGYSPDNSSAAGGTIILSNGGQALSVGAIRGGTVIIGSGGTASGFTPISGGTVTIQSGAYIASGASAQVTGDGTRAGILSAIGNENIGSVGLASNATVSLDSGATADALSAGTNGTIFVTDGGFASTATLTSGATAFLSNGGSASILSASNNVAAYLDQASAGTLNISDNASAFLSNGATANTINAANNATAFLNNGAAAGTLNISDNASAFLSNGATADTISAVNNATAFLNNGASANSVFLSSGIATITSGAIVSQLTVDSGGSGVLLSGASVIHVNINSGGWVSGANISTDNEMFIASSGTAIDTVVTYDAGSTSPTAPGSSHIVMQSGGYVSGATIIGAIPKSSGDTSTVGGLLTIESGATLLHTSMGYNARIRIVGLPYENGKWTTSVGNGTVFVTESSGTNTIKWTMELSGTNYEPDGFILNDDGQGNVVLIYDKCFLAGSMIRTPKGEKAVERLRKGEQVCVYVDGKEETRTITSVIQRRAHVAKDRPEDMAGWSVRIRQGAFGNNLPHADLSVTAEHCFYFEGRFVPVRMLVNGTTIRYDHSQPEFDYYHIETKPHSIIWANGTLTESWLNTDQEDVYEEDTTGALRLADRQHLNWDKHAAAPLGVDQAFVKPLYEQFAAQAHNTHITGGDITEETHTLAPTERPNVTDDPALYIRLENGEIIHPQRHEGKRYIFSLPAQSARVKIGSRFFRPSEAEGPYLDDRRLLGVLLGPISLWNGAKESLITRHLTDKTLQGWDVIEAGPHRWTNGEAELTLHDTPTTTIGQQILILDVLAGGPYKEGSSRP